MGCGKAKSAPETARLVAQEPLKRLGLDGLPWDQFELLGNLFY